MFKNNYSLSYLKKIGREHTYMLMQSFRAYGLCKKIIRLTTIQTSLGHFPNDKFRPLSKRI
jgi:hypothetical protein